MAVTKQPRLASDFWSSFFNKTIATLVVSQIIISAGIALALALIVNIDILWATAISGGFFALNLIILITLLVFATSPTKKLLASVIHAAGEQPELPLPTPNNSSDVKTGLADAVQTIYKLSSCQNDTPTPTTTKSADDIISGALDSTICGFVVMDDKRQIIYSNKSAPTKSDSDGKKSLDLVFNENDTINDWLDKCDSDSVHGEHIWTRIPDKLPNNEGRRFFDIIANYQKGAKSEVVLSLIDRSSTYTVDEENLDFMSFAAHELRGPITVIRGYLDVLNDELVDKFQDDQGELFHRLIISANRLSGYINNILNTSKYDRRHLKMAMVESTVAAVYATISDDMQMRSKIQNRALTVDLPDNLPTVAVDINSMGEVFSNLIDNAIKYSNEGGAINVTATANSNFIEVSFTDHGIGMPESVISNLFQKFYRSHRSRETVAGTGIGLYICKAIVESHGGTISVRSQDGRGSTFTVAIPIYSTVAGKLKSQNNSNQGIISEGRGWIKNHSMYRS
ncbi:MAG: HAMP domain-containing sensor histidine kinase [Candidatus Saccharibacteria bacterium]